MSICNSPTAERCDHRRIIARWGATEQANDPRGLAKSYRKSLRILSAVGSIMPTPCRRRIVQVASPTTNAAPITAGGRGVYGLD